MTGLRIDCDYNADLFDAATIDRWLGHFAAVLARVARDADLPIVRPRSLLAPASEPRATRSTTPPAELPARADRRWADRRGSAAAHAGVALAGRRRGATRTTPTAAARQPACEAHSRGAQADPGGASPSASTVRAISLAALLATLSAGCAYVPLDPAHPVARLRGIIEDAGASAVLTDGSTDAAAIRGRRRDNLPRRRRGSTSTWRRAHCRPSCAAPPTRLRDLTSGSTGKPKGVEVAHRSVVNLLTSMAKRPGLRAEDVLLAVTTVAFDIAALELFLPLSAGAERSSPPRATRVADGFALLSPVSAHGATAMQATPALWRILYSRRASRRGPASQCCAAARL